VRSSTSNSEAGHSSWLKAWLLAASLVVLIIAAWEVALRQATLEPNFSDNRALWLSARHRLIQPDENIVAILGASRVQRAVDVDVLSEQINRPVVQLAIEGSSGLPVLENLAADPRFHGTVVFSIAPAFSFNRRLSKLDAGNQADWMRAYLQQSRSRRIEQELRLSVQGLFAFRSTDAALSRTLPAILDTSRLPGPDYKKTYRNRFVSIDQSKFDGQVSQEGIVDLYRKNTEAYAEQDFVELMQYFGTLVDILKAKGSRVYVLRLPSDGAVLEFERRLFPQDKFWNQMQHHVDARFIHFNDYPELNGYLSQDGSHIAAEKAAEFTGQLALVLSANGLIPGASTHEQ
jgi:hypothetical protein